MAAIHQYLGFHNRNQAVRLTKCSIASESVCIGAVTSLARQSIGYRVNRPPLRESEPLFLHIRQAAGRGRRALQLPFRRIEVPTLWRQCLP